jgi:hypothetical protein
MGKDVDWKINKHYGKVPLSEVAKNISLWYCKQVERISQDEIEKELDRNEI